MINERGAAAARSERASWRDASSPMQQCQSRARANAFPSPAASPAIIIIIIFISSPPPLAGILLSFVLFVSLSLPWRVLLQRDVREFACEPD